MRTLPHSAARSLLAVLLVAVAACSDAGRTPVSPAETRPHLLAANSSEQLTFGDTHLHVPNQVAYTVQMPASGQIYLLFGARIAYGSTAGNSPVLEVLVNGVPATASLLTKGLTYTYPNRGGTENHYRAIPGYPSLWGVFWSPDFTQNNVSTDYYFVQGGNAYGYAFNISSLVSYGQANTITLRNSGGYLADLGAPSPIIVIRNIVLSAS